LKKISSEGVRKEPIVDTYAIIADLTGCATPAARRALDLVRLGEATGIVHYLIVNELTYLWRKTG